MNTAVILQFIKKLLPMNKIGAFILGLIGAALALILGTQNADLKKQYCASEEVNIPKIEAPAEAK